MYICIFFFAFIDPSICKSFDRPFKIDWNTAKETVIFEIGEYV